MIVPDRFIGNLESKKCFLAFFLTFAHGGNDIAWFNLTQFQ